MLSLNEAAELTGLNWRTLYRLEMRGLLSFQRAAGRVFIGTDDLLTSNIFTLGRAGAFVDRSWWTIREWRDAGILDVFYDFPGSKGRCSINAVTSAKERWSRRDGRRSAEAS